MNHRSPSRVLICAAALCVAATTAAYAVQPIRPGQQSFIVHALVAQGRLWALSDAGELFSIPLDAKKAVREPGQDPVLDICIHAGFLKRLVDRGRGDWRIDRLQGDRWDAVASIRSTGDQAVGLDCAGTNLAVLTNQRLVTIEGAKIHELRLSKTLVPEEVASVYGTPSEIFVGLNAGEWGGGLRRIDRKTGTVTVIQKNSTGELCDGPLNTDCDPVTAIASDPWNAKCIIIAIGLTHMAPHGRIDEVCGNVVREVFYKKYVVPMLPKCTTPLGKPCSTVAFYSLAVRNNEILALGMDGLYRIRKNGTATFRPLPSFVSAGGIEVSYDIPGFVLVLTDVNERRSVSGSVPLLVAR